MQEPAKVVGKYLIRNKKQPELYAHYNPREGAYIAREGIVGAAVYDRYNGEGAVKHMFGDEWELVPMGPVHVEQRPNSTEQELYDEFHKQ